MSQVLQAAGALHVPSQASSLLLSGGDTCTGDEAGGPGCGHLLGKGDSISILRTGMLCLMPPGLAGPLPHSILAQTWSQLWAGGASGGAFLPDRQTDPPKHVQAVN